MKRIKVTPIKSETLCERCDGLGNCLTPCHFCRLNLAHSVIGNAGLYTSCRCNTIKIGEPCRHFKRGLP